jgi:hypothetical protein
MTSVHPVEVINVSTIDSSRNNLEQDLDISSVQDISSIDIEIEKFDHESKSDQRTHNFLEILSNTPNQISTLKYILFGFCSIVLSLVPSFSFILIPVHNVILQPDYWYELPLQHIGDGIVLAAFAVIHSSYWMNIGYIKKVRYFLILSFTMVANNFLLYSSGYIIWTCVLGYSFPIPFIGTIVVQIALITTYTVFWFQFPIAWRKNDECRKRLKSFLAAIAFNSTLTLQYIIMTRVLIAFQENNQWVIALSLPIMRD